MDYLSFVLCLLLAGAAIQLLLSTAKKGNGSVARKLPPGPPPLPIVGNLFCLGTKPHIALSELAKTYGPLMTLQLGQVPTVVISSAAIAKEAIQKNDISFSSHVVTEATRALNHHENSLVWLPYSPKWRNLRKICNSHVFATSKLDASQGLRRRKVNDLLSHIESRCKVGEAVDIGQAAFTTTLNLLSSTFFSIDLGDPTTAFSREFRDNIRNIMEELGKPNFADYFPLLRKIDPQGIKRRMCIYFGKMRTVFNNMIDQRLEGKRPPGLQGNDVLDALLGINHEKPEGFEPSHIPDLLVDLFGAGTDTTAVTFEWAMAELLRNPEKLKKAQAELHDIIGKGNPVEESDVSRLPYLQAVVKETFRLHPAVPFLVPRTAEAEVTLSGFIVPKNAQVLVNIWAIGRDPDLWDNPNSFEPERFLQSEIDVKGSHFQLIPFGAGRRICPGLPLAIRTLHLMLGSLIHGFDWKLTEGVSPQTLDMEEKFGITVEKAQRLCAIPTRI